LQHTICYNFFEEIQRYTFINFIFFLFFLVQQVEEHIVIIVDFVFIKTLLEILAHVHMDYYFDQYVQYKAGTLSKKISQYKIFKKNPYFHPNRIITNTTSVKSFSASQDVKKRDYVAELDYKTNTISIWKFMHGTQIDYARQEFILAEGQRLLYWYFTILDDKVCIKIDVGPDQPPSRPSNISSATSYIRIGCEDEDSPSPKKYDDEDQPKYFRIVNTDESTSILPGGENWLFGINNEYLFEVWPYPLDKPLLIRKDKPDSETTTIDFLSDSTTYKENETLVYLFQIIHPLHNNRFCVYDSLNKKYYIFVESGTQTYKTTGKEIKADQFSLPLLSRIVQVGEKYYGYKVKYEQTGDKTVWTSTGMCEVNLPDSLPDNVDK